MASWLSFVVSNSEFVTFPLVSWVRIWYLIVLIPDLCTLTYLMAETSSSGPENLHTLVSVLRCILCFQRITFLRTYLSHLLLAGCDNSSTFVLPIFEWLFYTGFGVLILENNFLKTKKLSLTVQAVCSGILFHDFWPQYMHLRRRSTPEYANTGVKRVKRTAEF